MSVVWNFHKIVKSFKKLGLGTPPLKKERKKIVSFCYRLQAICDVPSWSLLCSGWTSLCGHIIYVVFFELVIWYLFDINSVLPEIGLIFVSLSNHLFVFGYLQCYVNYSTNMTHLEICALMCFLFCIIEVDYVYYVLIYFCVLLYCFQNKKKTP